MVERINFAFLNIGHFFCHFFILVFATVSALTLLQEWGISYAKLIPYATPGFVAVGVCAVPAGWLADKWNRKAMMIIFFFGIGLSSIITALARTPLEIGVGLFAIGIFAAIYHPVGIALVVQGREKTGVPLAINGIFGNLGVACAPLITGFFIDFTGWRSAFVWPGVVSIASGIVYAGFTYTTRNSDAKTGHKDIISNKESDKLTTNRHLIGRVFAIIFFSTAVGGFILRSTTFALPKIFDERLSELAVSATIIGWYAFIVLAIAAFGQLIVGYLVDRYSVRTVYSVVVALQAIFLGLMPGTSGLTTVLVSMAFMLVIFGQIPINDVLVKRISQSDWRSRVYAFRYIVTFTISASSIPILAWIYFHWNFDRLFAMLSIGAVCVFASVLMLPRAISVKHSL
jgi:MFS family permease